MKKLIFAGLLFISLTAFSQDLVTSVPFELFGNHIFITVSVDDSEPVDFIFDTGDGLAVIDLDVANNLRLGMDHKASKTSAQGSISGALIKHNKIEINDVKLEDIELYSTNLNHLEQSVGRNIDGIIGYDLLKNYVVTVDYDDMAFKLYDPASFKYEGKGEGFKFKLDSYIPHITCTVKLNNGEVFEEEFFINTGAGTTMDFNTVFAAKQKVIDKTGDHYSYPVVGIEKEETLHYEGRVMSFGFGEILFENLPVGISQAKHGVQHNKKVAGILGNGLLRRFNITYDYDNSMIYFETNQNYEKPFNVNASGLNLQLNKSLDKVLIHRVFEESPAEKAGIKKDAELISVNGKATDSYTLPELRDLLKSANKEVELVVLQDGAEKKVTLDLTPLI